jgi:hypothetical protein
MAQKIAGAGHRHLIHMDADADLGIAARGDGLGCGQGSGDGSELQHEAVAGGVEYAPAVFVRRRFNQTGEVVNRADGGGFVLLAACRESGRVHRNDGGKTLLRRRFRREVGGVHRPGR